ncbi:MAG TPA: hypothetical protein DHV14_01110, partial [Micrococcales bacterium]|nr:hypothetical protein [Micrococcales bacterium]
LPIRVLPPDAAPRATDGVATPRALVAVGDGRVQIQSGGGVPAATVADLVAAGVDALHSSASAVRRGEAQLSMGAADDGEGRAVLDEDLARAFVAAVRAARRQSPDTNA